MHGDAGIKRLLQVAHMLNIPAPAVAAEGTSTVELSLAEWPEELDVKLEAIDPGWRFRVTLDVPAEMPPGRRTRCWSSN